MSDIYKHVNCSILT